MVLVRLLLRFLIVPFGAMVAVSVGALVVVAAYWNRLAASVATSSAANDDFMLTLLFFGPVFALALTIMAIYMLLPATVGALIAEAFAIRHWIYHVANGGLSVWLGWLMMGGAGTRYDLPDATLVMVGAGLAAGFAYWAVAGWNAGFWKPAFAPRPPAALPQPPAVQP